MRAMLSRLAAAAFLIPLFAYSQIPGKDEPRLAVRTDPQYLIRIFSMHTQSRQLEKTCVLVYLDKSFHFERSKQEITDVKPRTTMVSSGHLKQELEKQLDQLLQNPDVASAQDSVHAGQMIPFESKARIVAAEIPRDKFRTQQVTGVQLEKQPVDPGLKALVSFMESIEATEMVSQKDIKPDLCKVPRTQSPAK